MRGPSRMALETETGQRGADLKLRPRFTENKKGVRAGFPGILAQRRWGQRPQRWDHGDPKDCPVNPGRLRRPPWETLAGPHASGPRGVKVGVFFGWDRGLEPGVGVSGAARSRGRVSVGLRGSGADYCSPGPGARPGARTQPGARRWLPKVKGCVSSRRSACCDRWPCWPAGSVERIGSAR